MALSTVPVLVTEDNVDDDSDYEDYPVPTITDAIVNNEKVEYYWGI